MGWFKKHKKDNKCLLRVQVCVTCANCVNVMNLVRTQDAFDRVLGVFFQNHVEIEVVDVVVVAGLVGWLQSIVETQDNKQICSGAKKKKEKKNFN